MGRRKCHELTHDDVLDQLRQHPYGISIADMLNNSGSHPNDSHRKIVWEQLRYVLKELGLAGKVTKRKEGRKSLYQLIEV